MNTRLKIRAYKRLSPRVFERLYFGFTFVDGGMRTALNENRMCYMLVAYYNREIVGWAGVYKGYYAFDDEEKYSIGVYVAAKYRHYGIGGKLRRKALWWALKHKLCVVWYDAKDNWAPVMAATGSMVVSRDLDEQRIGETAGRSG